MIYQISSGIVRSNVILRKDDEMFVLYSGYVRNTTINSGGELYISSGGKAENTTVNVGGYLYINNGASAISIKENGGFVDIEQGALVKFVPNTINNLTLNNQSATLHSGAIASNVTIRSGGILHLYDGASVKTVFVSGGADGVNGYLMVSSGAVVSNATIQFGGKLLVYRGGEANSANISSGGELHIYNGGHISGVTLRANGTLYLLKGGSAEGITISSGGKLNITVAPGTYINWTSGGSAFKMENGFLSNYIVRENEEFLIIDNGTAKNVTVDNNGKIIISSDGKGENTTVNAGGYLCISSGGKAENRTVNTGGYLYITSGASAIDIKENGGFVNIEKGALVNFVPNTIDNLTLNKQSATLHSGTSASDTTIDTDGNLYIYSGGKAENTTVNTGGYLYITSGASAIDIKENGGFVNFEQGALVNFVPNTIDNLTLNNQSATLHSGVITSNATIKSGGMLHLYDGASATTVFVSGGSESVYGYLTVNSGAVVSNATLNSNGVMFLYGAASACSVEVNNAGHLTITNEGSANDIVINSGGLFHIFQGGFASNITVNFSGYFQVCSGGSANNITVHNQLVANGKINDTTISSGGKLIVSEDGEANSTCISSGGELHISKGGCISGASLLSSGALYLSSGGSAKDVTITSGGKLSITVASGTYINGTSAGSAFKMENGFITNYKINANEEILVIDKGNAKTVTIDKGGEIIISNGGRTEDATVSGKITIFSGGSAKDVKVASSGTFSVSSGGTANETDVNDGGKMLIGQDGIASNVSINAGGKLDIASGASAIEVKENGGYVTYADIKNVTFVSHTIDHLELTQQSATIHSGTTANMPQINQNAKIEIYEGGIVKAAVVNSRGQILISSGGTAEKVTVERLGTLTVSKGGKANDVTVNSRGTLVINNEGEVNGAEINSSGFATVAKEGTLKNAVLSSGGTLLVSQKGKVTGATINIGGNLDILSGASVTEIRENGGYVNIAQNDISFDTFADNIFNNVTLSNGQSATVHAKTTANSTTINKNARMEVYGGIVSDTVINKNGALQIYSTGKAEETMVNSGGHLSIASGATATEITENGGYVDVAEGAKASFKENTVSSLTLFETSATAHSGTVISCPKIKKDATLTVFSSGSASLIEVSSGGNLYVSQGGLADKLTIYSGGNAIVFGTKTADDSASAVVNEVTNESGSTSLGKLNSVTICSGGVLAVYGGLASDTTVESDGLLSVYFGGEADNTNIISGGSCVVKDSGIVKNITVNAGAQIKVEDKGIVSNATIKAVDSSNKNAGKITVSSGGSAYSTIIESKGELIVRAMASAADTTVSSGGKLYISSGAKHEGTLQIESGATISAYAGSIIDLTLKGRTSQDDYMVNNLSLIDGAPAFSVTVTSYQTDGTYKLAQNVSDEVKAFSIYVNQKNVGSLQINDITQKNPNGPYSLKYDAKTYTLNKDKEDNLTLTVEGATKYFSGIFNEKTGVFELKGNGTGTLHFEKEKKQLSGTVDLNKWELLGIGDFNGDGNDDLLWKQKSEYKHSYVYVQSDLSSFDAIDVFETGKDIVNGQQESCLGVLDENYKILGIGDFTGTGIDGIIMQGPEFGDASISLNYGLPIWGREADGTTFVGWLGALVNTWQPGNTLKGDKSNLADINAKNYKYEVVSIGDYNGDGVNDVMLQNTMPETVDGVTISGSGDVFTFLTGNMDAVKAGNDPTVVYTGCAKGDWKIIGSGDFNGDGIDDVLLSNGENIAGWQLENGQRVGDILFRPVNEEIKKSCKLDEVNVISDILDLNADGTDDILVLNLETDQFTGWLVDNGWISGTIAIA